MVQLEGLASLKWVIGLDDDPHLHADDWALALLWLSITGTTE